MILAPQSSDRYLLLAPHPDDETLAVGGLLRRAAQTGAAIRVLYVTDGENNPWAQRANEWRWSIGSADRLRWGVRRRGEALAALRVLGLAPESAVFLGFPDQRVTDLVLAGDTRLAQVIALELATFGPTHFVLPSVQDAHPDHNTLAVAAALALDASPPVPNRRVYSYLVHRSRIRLAPAPARLSLTDDDLAAKRRAIECHQSQLKLNRGLFRFLTPDERLWPDDEALPVADEHPIRIFTAPTGHPSIDLNPGSRIALGRATLFLVAGRKTAEPLAMAIAIPDRPGPVAMRVLSGTASSTLEARATRTPENRLRLELSLPELTAGAGAKVFAKIEHPAERRLGFFDRAGWRAVQIGAVPAEGDALGRARTEERPDLAAKD